MATLQALVGQQTPATSQTLVNMRSGAYNDLIVTELQAQAYEQAVRGNTFIATNTAAVTLPATLAATAATCALSNDNGSGYNLVIRKVGLALSAAPAAAAAVMLVFNNSTTNVTHTTPVTIQPAKLGSGSAPAGKFDASATLPTAPIALIPLLHVTAASAITPAPVWVDIAGGLIIPPGGYVAIQGTSAVVGLGSFVFDVVPVTV